MTYHQGFDRLGNPVARRTKTVGHHLIRDLALAMLLFVLACAVSGYLFG